MARPNLLDVRTIDYMELIGNGRVYSVPPFQRDYSWSEEQWEVLWDDLLELRSEPERRHYLGAVVVEARNDREFQVIDGQQRLATLSLFALAVIDRLEEMARSGIDREDNTERARALRNRFIGEKDPASLIESSRLRLNESDNAFYQDYLIQLQNPLNPRGLSRSNRLLFDCLKYFSDRLRHPDLSRDDGRTIAGFLSETVARQLLFILITVDDELNAYTVFETLNARGLELTTTDLLKNHLFSRISVPADLEMLRRRWSRLAETVGQTRFPAFLRYHLLTRQPKVRGRRVFVMLRERTRTAPEVLALLGELEGRGQLFSAMYDRNHDLWLDIPAARPYIAELDLFGIRQPAPLLFTAWEEFSDADFVRVLKLVAAISFRYTVVSRLNTRALEPAYHRAARAVADGEARTPAAVFDRLRSVYVDDEKMRQDFTRLEMDTRGVGRRRVKHVLAQLEREASGRAVDPDTDPGTIEHVLPENPGDAWNESYPEDKWESGVYRVGNLTLLEAPMNRDVGNDVYTEKCTAYGESKYALTQAIPEMAPERWTPELVAGRQRRLAEVAARVWRSDFA